MIKEEITIKNKHGIHTRPATVIVETASNFESEIFLTYNGEKSNAKSIMGILILAVEPGATVELETSGSDEKEAMKQMLHIIKNNFFME